VASLTVRMVGVRPGPVGGVPDGAWLLGWRRDCQGGVGGLVIRR
jgi:hypothetical protein